MLTDPQVHEAEFRAALQKLADHFDYDATPDPEAVRPESN
jgi:hypothetical protein